MDKAYMLATDESHAVQMSPSISMEFQWLVVKSFQHFRFIYARRRYLLKVCTVYYYYYYYYCAVTGRLLTQGLSF